MNLRLERGRPHAEVGLLHVRRGRFEVVEGVVKPGDKRREVLKRPELLVAMVMHVLTDENTAGTEVRKRFLKCDDLLLGRMPAVVDDDVGWEKFVPKPLLEATIGLIANGDPGVFVFKHLANRRNVHARDSRPRAKVRMPHPHASTAINANLDEVRVLADELDQVPLVNFEVVQPLEDARSFRIGLEIRAQRVRRSPRSVPVRGPLSRGPGLRTQQTPHISGLAQLTGEELSRVLEGGLQ